MLRLTTYIGENEIVVKVEGCLAGPWVREVNAVWRDVTQKRHARPVRVDLTDVCHADSAGRELIEVMFRAGVHFVARGCVLPELLRELAQRLPAGSPEPRAVRS